MSRKRVSSKKPVKRLRTGPQGRGGEMREIASDSRSIARKSQTNDPEWYNNVPNLLGDVASIVFSNSSGIPYSLNNVSCMEPGIMTYSVVPTIGDSGDPNSAINIAAYNLYSYVRHANSGSVNYDSPDLMLYAIAIAQIYSYINYCMRVYGVINLYSHANRYLPKALVTAMGWDYDNIISSLPNFRAGLNVLIHKAASLACPATITYFRRLAFLFSGIYAEGESVKSQLYLYNPIGFMQYNDAFNEQGGGMSILMLPPNMTTQEMIDYGNRLLDPIISSESMNIMSGDILKAYGDNILKLMPLDESYVVLPITDLNVLEQMSNSDVLLSDATETSSHYVFQIVQNIGTTNQRPHLYAEARISEKTNVPLTTASHIINTILTNPTAGDVIERTRGMITTQKLWEFPSAPPSDPTKYANCRILSGSDIIVSCNMWSYDAVTRQLIRQNVAQSSNSYYTTAAAKAIWETSAPAVQTSYTFLQEYIRIHCMLESFKFHPKVFYFTSDVDGNLTLYNQFAMDLDNYATIDNNKVLQLNEDALLSLFDVPSIGRF